MKLAILQSNYIPWKGYFDLINDVDCFVFYDCVKYTKNDWRNRNKIYVNPSLQWLTVPIASEATKQLIDEVTINDNRWQDAHFKTLYMGYKKAPYFFQLEELMIDFLKERRWDNLSRLNQYTIQEISKKIGIQTKFIDSRELDLRGDRVDRLVNICLDLKATEYISGPAAMAYLDGNEDRFLMNDIALRYKQYPNYPAYLQMYPKFENYVSIVDLVAHIGWDDIKNYIWK